MHSNILSLDVGGARIGVALASKIARLPAPLTTLKHDDKVWDNIKALCLEHDVESIVVGWPRNLNGSETDQTRETMKFVENLRTQTNLPVHLQDEAGTSKQAEAELKSRGRGFDKGEVDALAATYILEDFLRTPSKESL